MTDAQRIAELEREVQGLKTTVGYLVDAAIYLAVRPDEDRAAERTETARAHFRRYFLEPTPAQNPRSGTANDGKQ